MRFSVTADTEHSSDILGHLFVLSVQKSGGCHLSKKRKQDQDDDDDIYDDPDLKEFGMDMNEEDDEGAGHHIEEDLDFLKEDLEDGADYPYDDY